MYQLAVRDSTWWWLFCTGVGLLQSNGGLPEPALLTMFNKAVSIMSIERQQVTLLAVPHLEGMRKLTRTACTAPN